MKRRFLFPFAAVIGVLTPSGRLQAGESSGPPPAFDEAVAAAKREGKPLVIELFAGG